jgi:hypothetical protein
VEHEHLPHPFPPLSLAPHPRMRADARAPQTLDAAGVDLPPHHLSIAEKPSRRFAAR